MEKGEDPYEILGVSYDATDDEIKKTYRKAALKYHPDRQTSEEDKEKAHDVFARISAAYDVLTDPVKRYDWKQANEEKLKRSNSDTGATPSSKPQPRPPPPRRQHTDPSPGPPRRKNSAPPPSTQPRTTPPPPTSKTPPPPGRHQRASAPAPAPAAKNGSKPQPQQRAKPASAPPPPSNGFSWSRSKQPNPNSANAAKSSPNAYPSASAAGKKENMNAPSNAANSSSYSGGGAGQKEDPNAPNTSYSAAGMKEDLRGPTATKTKKKSKASAAADTSYSGGGMKEDLRSPVGRNKKRNNVPADTSYSAAGAGIKEDFRSPTAKKTTKKKTAAKTVTSPSAYSSKPNTKEDPNKLDSSYSVRPNMKEDPHHIDSSYSMAGQNGYPVERTYTPSASSPRRKVRAYGAASVSGPPLSNDSDHGTVSSRHTYAAGQERFAGQERAPRRNSGSNAGRKNRYAKPNGIRSRSQSPRKGRPTDLVDRLPRGGGKKAPKPSINDVHDPFETFERFVRLEFADEDFAKNTSSDWVAKGLFGEKKETKLKAKPLEYFDPNAVMSMSTSTKTEKRKDDGLYDVKTITKVLRGDGSVETVRQSSVCDKEHAKSIPKDKTVTITREVKEKKKKK